MKYESLLPEASEEVRKMYSSASHEILLRAISGAHHVNEGLRLHLQKLEELRQETGCEPGLLVQQARLIEVLLDLIERLAKPPQVTHITGDNHERDQS